MMRARDDAIHELLDGGPWDDGTLRRNLRDIRRINGLLGWRAAVVRGVAREVRTAGLRAFSLLDVASGSADIPAAIARWAARAGTPARIVASDLSPQIVAIASEACAGTPGLSVEQQDALAVTYPTGSFDLALCTLALHHFAPDDAVRLLRELARVGRRVLVYDAQRARLAYLGVIALTRLLRMDPMTCHDAPSTVRRAYSAGELRALAARAGLRNARVRMQVPYRLVLVADGNGDGNREGREASAKYAKRRGRRTRSSRSFAEHAENKSGEERESREASAKGEKNRDAASSAHSAVALSSLTSVASVASVASVVHLSPSSRSSRILRDLRDSRKLLERAP